MKQFILFQIVTAIAALVVGMGFCNKHFKKFILIAGIFLGFAGIAHAQTYTPKSPGAFVTLWKASGSTMGFPGVGAYGIAVYDITAGGGALYSNASASGTATITGTNTTDVYAIETTGLTQFINGAAVNGKLQQVVQWGATTWTTMNSAFYNAAQMTITATDAPVLTGVTDMSSMFYGCALVISVPGMNTWNVSSVTTMNSMFYNATLFNESIGNWNVSNVTDMYQMFYSAKAFNQPVGNWNVSSVKNMSFMFYQAWTFNQPINNWNVSSVTNMSGMFFGATAFNQLLGNWKTGNVLDMSQMFQGAVAFNQSQGNWDLSKINNMTSMFGSSGLDCISYSGTLTGWASNLTGGTGGHPGTTPHSSISFNADGITYSPSASAARVALVTAGWTITDGGPGTCLLQYTPSNSGVFVTFWKAGSNTITFPGTGNYGIAVYDITTGGSSVYSNTAASGTQSVTGLNNADVYAVEASGLKQFQYGNATTGTLLEVTQWGTSAWTTMNNAFFNAGQMTVTAKDAPVLTGLTDLSNMFYRCTALDSVPGINTWNISSVQYTSGMFSYATSFNQSLNGWNVSSVLDMSQMFFSATAFNQPLNNWKTGSVTTMSGMFMGATSFNQPVGGWNVSAVTDMSSMFDAAASFNQPLDNWDVSKVTSMNAMFYNAAAFDQSLGNWNLSSISSASAMSTMLSNSGLDCIAYSGTLTGWASNLAGGTGAHAGATQKGITLGAANITYSPNQATAYARAALVTAGWTITDGGPGTCLLQYAPTSSGVFATLWKPTGNSVTFPGTGSYSIRVSDITNGNIVYSGTETGSPAFSGLNNSDVYAIETSGLTQFQNSPIATGTLLQVAQWGTTAWTDMNSAFSGAGQMIVTAKDTPVLTGVTNMSNMFNGCTSLDTIHGISGWNVSAVTTMFNMFAGATKFNSSLAGWDVSSVKNMGNMFNGAASFNQPIGNWNVSGVTNMTYMFAGATAFNQLLNNWDVSSVPDMTNMFNGATSFNQPLGNWNLSKVTIMTSMLSSSGLDCINYSNTLAGWASNLAGGGGTHPGSTPPNIVFGADNLTYSLTPAGQSSRAALVAAGWAITDAGPGSCTLPYKPSNSNVFVTLWTPNSYNQIFFQTGSTYNATVYDTTTNTYVPGYRDIPLTASYKFSGLNPGDVYAVETSGLAWFFYGGPPEGTLTDVVQWGTTPWTTMNSMFNYASQLTVTATDAPNLTNVTDMSSMFSNCSSLDSVPGITNWDVSSVQNMSGMFSYATAFNQSLNGWGSKTSNVTNTSNMFNNATSFNQPVNNWNISSDTDMSNMFLSATSFNQPLDTWDVSSVTNMSGIFQFAKSFNQSLNGWGQKTGKVTNMSWMFSYDPLFNQPLDNWNVSSVTDMSWMFYSDEAFNQLLSSWNVSSVTNMYNMFSGASSFNQPLDTWNVSNVTNMGGMLSGTPFNKSIENWNVNSVQNMSGMFYNATSFNSPLNGWGSTTSKVTDMSSMFYGASLFNQPLDNWKISSVKSTASMFAFASNFNSSLNGWGSTTGNVQDMSFMFEWDTAFNQPLDNWDVSSVTNMGYMFYGAYKFNSPLNNWGSKTGNVTDMSEMFFNDTSFNQPINSWDVSSVANMSYMFYTAYRFNQPLNNWKVSKVVSMPYMFGSATAFNQSLGNWNLSSINDMTSMLDYSGLDCINYANTLYGWASNLGNTTPSGAIPFGAAGHKHSSADSIVAAYNALSAAGWIITDDGEGTCVIITPVTLLNFTAEAQANNTALLQWATVTEANNKGFDVQRSTDGASWIDLAFVNSQAPGGNSSLQLHYQYTDNSPFAGNNYYRLKQVDLSGTATYSAVRELSFNNLATLQASPNPASGEVRVTLPAGAGNNVPYKLTGTNGSVILSGTMSNISGYGRISVSNVASGLYFLQIMTNNVVQTCKLQVAH